MGRLWRQRLSISLSESAAGVPGRMCQRTSSVGGILVACEGKTQKQITGLKRKINRFREAETALPPANWPGAGACWALIQDPGLGRLLFQRLVISARPPGARGASELVSSAAEAQNRECKVQAVGGRRGVKVPAHLVFCPFLCARVVLGPT